MAPGGEERLRWLAPALGLVLVLVLRGAADWRYFERFLGDHGWPLRVAERVTAGELLYRDVGWDYGPLPIYVLAACFAISDSVLWSKLLDLLLAGSAVCAVFLVCRRLVPPRASLVITAWAAFLGSSEGLITHQLTAYTSAVAWGAAASLLTVVAACSWVGGRSSACLALASLLALASVLSKPEYGLAAVSVLVTASVVRRPPRSFWIAAALVMVVGVTSIAVGSSQETLLSWWRGYSGYDLIRVGQVPLASGIGMLGGLLVSAAFVLAVWSRAARLVLALALLAVLFWRWAAGGPVASLLALADGAAEAAWTGAIPALAWLAWRGRSGSLAPEFWVVCAWALTVNLRLFLHGWPCAVAAGPVAALVWYLVGRGIVPRPSRAGFAVLALVAVVLPLRGEIHSISRPFDSEPVATRLGTVRVPPRMAGEIEELRPHLDAAPAGPLFVLGGGPGWYLVSGRNNPTRFDVAWNGIGTTEPEASRILADLRADPPAFVIVERDFDGVPHLSQESVWAAIGAEYAPHARTRSGRWEMYRAD